MSEITKLLNNHGWTGPIDDNGLEQYTHPKFPDQKMSIIRSKNSRPLAWVHHQAAIPNGVGPIATSMRGFGPASYNHMDLKDYIEQLHAEYPEGADINQIRKQRFQTRYTPKRLNEHNKQLSYYAAQFIAKFAPFEVVEKHDLKDHEFASVRIHVARRFPQLADHFMSDSLPTIRDIASRHGFK